VVTEVARALRTAEAIDDDRFDRLYPPVVRALAERHWTPIRVALRAAELLVAKPGARVLDVGAGAGKFCIVGALASDAEFVGVEQRPHLVEAASALATTLGAERARCLLGNAFSVDWREFDAIYLFNPFQEHVGDDAGVIDRTISIGPRHHIDAVSQTRAKLREARIGTRVVTYYGFGGRMPGSFRRTLKEPHGDDWLELWIKEPSSEHPQRPDC
jgi:SAM-dependent methyltransferase